MFPLEEWDEVDVPGESGHLASHRSPSLGGWTGSRDRSCELNRPKEGKGMPRLCQRFFVDCQGPVRTTFETVRPFLPRRVRTSDRHCSWSTGEGDAPRGPPRDPRPPSPRTLRCASTGEVGLKTVSGFLVSTHPHSSRQSRPPFPATPVPWFAVGVRTSSPVCLPTDFPKL